MLRAFLLWVLCGTFAKAAEIRTFSLETLEQLGEELYQRDSMAAAASDLVVPKLTPAERKGGRGWITQADRGIALVYFIQEVKGEPKLAFIVNLGARDQPEVEDRRGAALPAFVAKRFAARVAAIKAIPHFFTERYNFEVLDDPDGSGFLVYALAGTTKDEIMMTGHYRVTVAEDGKVEQVDALSKSLVVLPKEKNVAATFVTHMVSATPVETHVFVSLLHKLAIYVATGKDTTWKVDGAKIARAKLPK